MSFASEWREKEPDFPWLAAGDINLVTQFMRTRNWLAEIEQVQSCDRAGEGNMNLTLRVITSQRSVILKQARPWVEKYDFIPAPWDRATFEARFYARVAGIEGVADRMPRLIAADENAKALLLEDLCDAVDRSDAYAGAPLAVADLVELADYLRALHAATAGAPDPSFENRAMRELNHEHIFNVPMQGTDTVDLEALEPGLGAVAAELRADAAYRARTEQLGARYLSDGRCLLHGDFFPGSWLGTPKGIRVIDPEFCFYGDPEFDLAVAIAHLRMTNSPIESAAAILDAYALPHDASRVAGYAATEIVRRTIGVAQLPLAPGTTTRSALLRVAQSTFKHDDWRTLWG